MFVPRKEPFFYPGNPIYEEDPAMREMIYKRKSVRWYRPEPLRKEVLAGIQAKIDEINPLFSDAEFSVKLIDTPSGRKGSAPHHLIFCGEEKEAVLENIGFVGQHLSLYLSSIGVGSFWKMTKPSEAASGVDSPYPIVITMAFGTPMEPLYREPKEFKRKSLSVISEGDDPRLEAARLAPSAMNEQDWFFSADEGGLHCYRKKHGMLAAAMKNTLNCIDMGIVLCHIAVKSDEFRFEKISDAPVRQGYLYVGTVI